MHSPSAITDKQRTICVFCGSSMGHDEEIAQAARALGALIAQAGHRFLFGGGTLGLMGQSARAARDAGAPVIGVIPNFLRHLEPPLKSAEELIATPDLYQRKDRMIALSDAFVVLPGGLGTLDEFFEVVTSAQLEVHAKPIVLLNANGFWDPLLALIDHVVARGFARADVRGLFHVATHPEEAMTIIKQTLAEGGGASRG